MQNIKDTDYERLTIFADGYNLHRSTKPAVIDFVDRITQAIEQGKFSVGIFLDLSKSLDTINHRMLIRKLKHYSIRGEAKVVLRTTYVTENK